MDKLQVSDRRGNRSRPATFLFDLKLFVLAGNRASINIKSQLLSGTPQYKGKRIEVEGLGQVHWIRIRGAAVTLLTFLRMWSIDHRPLQSASDQLLQ